MPLNLIITKDTFTIYLWKISETIEALLCQLKLSETTFERFNKRKSETHQRSFLAIQHLLLIAGYSDKNLKYNSNGAPFLTDGKFISISHSNQYASLVISEVAIGIDIEKIQPRMLSLSEKFLGKEKDFLNFQSQNILKSLTKIWCAKEAVYKLYTAEKLSFKNQIFIEPENNIKTTAIAFINCQNASTRCNIFYVEIENFILACATN